MKRIIFFLALNLIFAFGFGQNMSHFTARKRIVDTLDIKNWKHYTLIDANIFFLYPDFILQMDSTNKQLTLSHSVPYEHPDYCDLSDSKTSIPSKLLSDISFSIKAYKTDLKEVLKLIEGNYFLNEYFSNDSLKLEPNFIDTIHIGKLKGYTIHTGAEGCGIYFFIFPITDSLTLLIRKPYSPEFIHGLLPEDVYIKYISVKGIISPEQSERIFYKILETIQ